MAKRSKKILIGNWKMNPETLSGAKEIVRSVRASAKLSTKVTTVICPPFPYLSSIAQGGNSIKIGAQNVFFENRGAFTGEVSPSMLITLGVSYVIIGHSERRRLGETDDVIAKKALASAQYGLKVVLCIGETTRDENGDYLRAIEAQLSGSLAKFSKKHVSNLIVAYEPVWAIGAEKAMDEREVHETTIFIRKILSNLYGRNEAAAIPILYGGSVAPDNASDIVKKGEVNGLLVGRESLNPKNFGMIMKGLNSI